MCVGLVQTHRAFACNNAWANHRLLGACAGLTQGEFEAERTGFFPSLQATLNHIYVIDLFYIDALEGGWLGPAAWKNEVPFPALTALKSAQAAMDRRLIAICDALTPARLDGVVKINRDTRVQTERCDRLLMHLFQHQIHHRDRRMPCCPRQPSRRRNSTSSLRKAKRHSGLPSSPSSAGPKRPSGNPRRKLRQKLRRHMVGQPHAIVRTKKREALGMHAAGIDPEDMRLAVALTDTLRGRLVKG